MVNSLLFRLSFLLSLCLFCISIVIISVFRLLLTFPWILRLLLLSFPDVIKLSVFEPFDELLVLNRCLHNNESSFHLGGAR